MITVTSSRPLRIALAHATEAEAATRAQLNRVVSTFDLDAWRWTDDVRIAEGEVPHSHPMLTLNTRHVGFDDRLLATYLHEQLHWWLDSCSATATGEALADLRRLWPVVPSKFPLGADGEESTYLHLIVRWLEIDALRKVLGDLRARHVLEHWVQDHYTWVYERVSADDHRLREVVEAAGLVPPATGR